MQKYLLLLTVVMQYILCANMIPQMPENHHEVTREVYIIGLRDDFDHRRDRNDSRFLVTKYLFKIDLSLHERLFGGVLPSFATLPYLWFVLPIFFTGNFTLYVITGEITVTLIETFLLSFLLKLSYKKAFMLSALANFVSYSLGKLIQSVI